MLPGHRILWASRHPPSEKETTFFVDKYGQIRFYQFPASVEHGNEICRRYREQFCDDMVLIAPNQIYTQVLQAGIKPLRPIGWVENHNYQFKGFQQVERAVLETEPLHPLQDGLKILWLDNHQIDKNQRKRLLKQGEEIRSLRYLRNVAHMAGLPLKQLLLRELKNENVIIVPAKMPLWRLSWVKAAAIERHVLLVKQTVEPAVWYNKTYTTSRGYDQRLTQFEVVTKAIWEAESF